MSHSNRIVAVKRGSLLAAALAVVLAVGAVIQTVLKVDAYAGLKATSRGVDPALGVRVEGVTLRSYDKNKLVVKAKMDRLDVRQDKQQYDLFGVTDGLFFSKKGALEFAAPKAKWNVPTHQLEAPDGGRIKGKEADLHVPQFAFNSKTGVMNTLGEVKGKILHGEITGDIQARGVRYNVNSGAIHTGPMAFNGKIPLSFQEGDKPQLRTWNIEGKDVDVDGDVWVYLKAIATDGDIYVLADRVEHNRKTDVVTATGNVRYFSVKTNLICGKAVIDRKAKKATLTDNVQMLLKAKEKQTTVSVNEGIPPFRPVVPEEIAKTRPQADVDGPTEAQKKLDDEIRSGKNMRDYPTICYAEKIIYWYAKGNRHAEISGNPQARQEMREGAWRQIWTNMAFYDGEADTLQMVSTAGKEDTRMINSIGDDVTAESLNLSTKEGDERMKGKNVKATLSDRSDEIPKADKPKPTTTTGGGTGQNPPPPNRTKPPLSGEIGGRKRGG
jgi:hypothetical protein